MFALWCNVATDFQQWVSHCELQGLDTAAVMTSVWKKRLFPLQFYKISLWIEKKNPPPWECPHFLIKCFFQIKVSITCFMSSHFQIAHSAGWWKRDCFTRRQERWTVSVWLFMLWSVMPCDCLSPTMRAHLCFFRAHLASDCTASVRNQQPATISSQNLLTDSSQSLSSFTCPHFIFF